MGLRTWGTDRRSATCVLVLGAVAALLVGCGSGADTPQPPRSTPPAPSTSPAPSPPPPVSTALPTLPTRPVTHPTVWLCRPGMPDNPCQGGLDATMIGPGGERVPEPFLPAADPGVDCFYVYPTVSGSSQDNAPLEVTAAEVRAVRAQAARFAESCRLFAPVYRQITRKGLVSGALADAGARDLAYADVLSAFNDYLNTDGSGRPVVLIGHSQGANTLVRLIQEQVDGDPAVRSRVLSALLLGTSVTTLPGELDGGTFQNLPACTTPEQSGCVVSYVTYSGAPPENGIFGRSTATRRALCVSPADLLGRGPQLAAYLPTAELTGGEPLTQDPPGRASSGSRAWCPGAVGPRRRSAGWRSPSTRT